MGQGSGGWEQAYGINGGWRMALPGQARFVADLGDQGRGVPADKRNGLFLAGEAMSWYGLSGWVEGAMLTGINASIAAHKWMTEA